MTTSLAEQLRRLQTPQSSLFVDTKKRDSILFTVKEAATKSRETIYEIGLNGLQELIEMNPMFVDFQVTLFDFTAKDVQRAVETKEVNTLLNKNIKRFLFHLSPYFMIPASHKCLEWLVRRFNINLYNKEEFLMLILPYHQTNMFVRCVQTMKFDDPTDKWNFLVDVKKMSTPLSKLALWNYGASQPSFLGFVGKFTYEAIKELGSKAGSLQTMLAFYCTTTIGAMEQATTINDNHILNIAKYLVKAFKSSVVDFAASGHMITAQLLVKAKLGIPLLNELMDKFTNVLDITHAIFFNVGDQLRSEMSLPHSMPQRAQLDFQVGVKDIGISRVMSPTQHDTNSLVIVKLTDLQAELAIALRPQPPILTPPPLARQSNRASSCPPDRDTSSVQKQQPRNQSPVCRKPRSVHSSTPPDARLKTENDTLTTSQRMCIASRPSCKYGSSCNMGMKCRFDHTVVTLKQSLVSSLSERGEYVPKDPLHLSMDIARVLHMTHEGTSLLDQITAHFKNETSTPAPMSRKSATSSACNSDSNTQTDWSLNGFEESYSLQGRAMSARMMIVSSFGGDLDSSEMQQTLDITQKWASSGERRSRSFHGAEAVHVPYTSTTPRAERHPAGLESQTCPQDILLRCANPTDPAFAPNSLDSKRCTLDKRSSRTPYTMVASLQRDVLRSRSPNVKLSAGAGGHVHNTKVGSVSSSLLCTSPVSTESEATDLDDNGWNMWRSPIFDLNTHKLSAVLFN